LTVKEAQKFFSAIFDLNFKNEKDRNAFKKIMKVIDPESKKLVNKENILLFF